MKLKELTSKIGSGATPKGGKSSYLGGTVNLIRSMNVRDLEFDYVGLAQINQEQAARLDNVTVMPRDVLLNITGDSITRCCTVPDSVLPARVNQHVSIIRPKEDIDPDYLCYYLQFLKPYLLNVCRVGGTRNALTKEALEEIEIHYPIDASARARTLSSIDALIMLNNQINDNLRCCLPLVA